MGFVHLLMIRVGKEALLEEESINENTGCGQLCVSGRISVGHCGIA
jgi:hypothetical protein